MASLFTAEAPQASGSLGETGSPITDTSGATRTKANAAALSQVAGTALEAHKGITVGKAQAEDEAAINQFFQTLQGGQAAEEAESSGLVKDDDPILKQASDDAQKLSDAAKSGAISVSELQLRLETKKRERINQFPGYAPEFRQVYGEVMSDNKIRLGLVEAMENSKNAALSSMEKTIRSQAQTLGIADYHVAPIDQLVPEITRINSSKTEFTLWKNDRERAKAGGANAFYKGLPGMGLELRDGLTAWMADVRARTGKAPSLSEFSDYGTLVGNQYKSLVRKQFGSLLTETQYAAADDTVDSTIQTFQDIISGKLTIEEVENRNKLTTALYQEEFLADPTRARLKTLTENIKGEAAIQIYANILEDPNAINAFKGVGDWALQGGMAPMQYTPDPSYTKGLNAFSAQTLANYENANWNELSQQGKTDIVNSTNGIYSLLNGNRPQYGTEEADAVLDIGSSNAYYERMINDPSMNGTRQNLQQATTRFIGDWSTSLVELMQEPMNLSAGPVEVGGTGGLQMRDFIVMNVDESGSIVFTPNQAMLDQASNPNSGIYRGGKSPTSSIHQRVTETVSMMNQNYAPRYNKAVRAYAHSNGNKEYAKASSNLFGQFSRGAFPTTRFAGQPANYDPRVEMALEIPNIKQRMAKVIDSGVELEADMLPELLGVANNQKATDALEMLLDGQDPATVAEMYENDPVVQDLITVLMETF